MGEEECGSVQGGPRDNSFNKHGPADKGHFTTRGSKDSRGSATSGESPHHNRWLWKSGERPCGA